MTKNKLKLALIFSFFVIATPFESFAIGLDELNFPSMPAGRMGISNTPEPYVKEVKIKDNSRNDVVSKTNINDIESASNYADLSLKKLAQDVVYDLSIEQEDMLSDLQILWNAAASRSETIKYTIYKLSNPDEDKPNESIVKKILRPIANMSAIAGTAVGSNPFVASGALVGGGLLNAFVSDDKEINYKFTKVTDADMVVLVRKIDDLQKKLLGLYVDYLTKKEIMAMTAQNLESRRAIYEKAQNKPKQELIIADVYYRNAQNAAKKAQAEYYASRTILENLVGNQALDEIENREKTSPI